GGAGNALADSVWKNPIPIAFIGLGVGMLVMRRFGVSSSGLHQQRMKQMSENTSNLEGESLQKGGTVSRTFQQVKNTASDLASRSTDNLSALSSQAKDSATQVSNRFGEVMRDSARAGGAAALAGG